MYKAYDTDQGIDVAWNAIDIASLPPGEKSRIIQEVQLLQKLEHKNIINFYGSWFLKEKNQVVFITEIMTAGTLTSYIKRVQFVKWKIIKRWCIQILEGLEYLHSQSPPIIHRDLKCDNIFINGNTGDIRIGDLGLSTQMCVEQRAQSVLGTPEFMAPELYDENYDEKVDIYAFGMCVLEMVTKEVPYSECTNPAQIYKKVIAGIRPKGLLRVISDSARSFIELCLSRGDGKVDVTATYLLGHPFLQPCDLDGEDHLCTPNEEMVDADLLTMSKKRELELLATDDNISTEKMAQELNMENSSSSTFSSTSAYAHPLKMATSRSSDGTASSSSTSACIKSSTTSSSSKIHRNSEPNMAMFEQLLTEKVQSQHTAKPGGGSEQNIGIVSTAAAAAVDTTTTNDQMEDEHAANEILATMPGNESEVIDDRVLVMDGRSSLAMPVASTFDANVSHEPPTNTTMNAFEERRLAHLSFSSSSLNNHSRNSSSRSTPKRRPSPPPPVIESSSSSSLNNHSRNSSSRSTPKRRPSPPPPVIDQTSTELRKRGNMHDIRATEDPDHEFSILLNLRTMIDGKSKEIKFPFNLFTDVPHEVVAELATDVGILEPEVDTIVDSIVFLATEGKIKNLDQMERDVWEEAPEPHSFNVRKDSSTKDQMLIVAAQSSPPPSSSSSSAAQLIEQQPGKPPQTTDDRENAAMIAAEALLRGVNPQGGLKFNPGLINTPHSISGVTMTQHRNPANLNTSNASTPPLGETTVSAGVRASILPPSSTNPMSTTPTLTTTSITSTTKSSEVDNPEFLRQYRNYEGKLQIAQSAFDQRELSLEAAIKSEEEKHLREMERYKKKMEEFERKKQRAALARVHRMEQVAAEFKAEVQAERRKWPLSSMSDPSLPLGNNNSIASQSSSNPHSLQPSSSSSDNGHLTQVHSGNNP